MQGFLVFDSLVKSFGETRALNGVSLEVAQGEVFSLLGPSGCGKTTLLRVAAGFERPDSGRVFLDGQDITDLPPNRRPVNTVFQNYALFPHLSVKENIAFGLRVAGKPKAEINREVGAMLEMVQLSSHATKKPAQLSGGQKQRVAIARALVNKPRVLLLDEPLAALDLKLRQRMLLELTAIHREVGTTFIYVTHDQTEAMSLSHRIAVMNGGQVEQCGAPVDLYERPVSGFVASFIGDTNRLEGVVTASESIVSRVRLADGTELHVRGALPPGVNASLSLRPERIHLEAAPPAMEAVGGRNHLEGILDEKIYLGSAIRCWITFGALRLCVDTTLQRTDHLILHLARGQKVWLSFTPDDVTLVRA